MGITEALEQHMLGIAYREARDILGHLGYDGDTCLGFTNSYGQELEDCVQVMDDEGHGVFLIFINELDKGTFHGVMCEKHRAPNIPDEDYRRKIISEPGSVISVIKWGLGI